MKVEISDKLLHFCSVSDEITDTSVSHAGLQNGSVDIYSTHGYATSGTNSDSLPFLRMLPNDFDIFRDLILNDQSIPNNGCQKGNNCFNIRFSKNNNE